MDNKQSSDSFLSSMKKISKIKNFFLYSIVFALIAFVTSLIPGGYTNSPPNVYADAPGGGGGGGPDGGGGGRDGCDGSDGGGADGCGPDGF